MTLYLLDSDAIIDYLRGMPGAVSFIGSLLDRGDSLCVCDVVVAEVYSGVRPDNRNEAQGLLDTLIYLPITRETARQAGEWRYLHARQGIALPTTDTLIAATAHAHNASIVTGNKKDYPMEELSLTLLPRARSPKL